MPRKKASESLAPNGGARITCPACKSEVSSDGATLHARSKYLEELIETDGDVEKLETAIAGLEGKLAAAKQELAAGKSKAAVQTKTEGEKSNGTVEKKRGSESKPASGDWW